MNLYAIKQRFRYHYKKYLAIIFSSLAWLSLIASMGIRIYDFAMTGYVSNDFTFIWNLCFTALVYSFILIGNIQGTSLAYNGILIFIFSAVFNGIINLAMNGLFAGLSSGGVVDLVVTLLYLLFLVAVVVTGIMTYLRTRQYLMNSYASYRGLFWWSLAFCVLSAISAGFYPIMIGILSGWDWLLFIEIFASLGDCFISVAIFFTILRLKSEY